MRPALVVAIGEFARAFKSTGADDKLMRCFESAEDAAMEIGSLLRGDELVLLKGSRGARVERVLDAIDG